MLGHQAVDAAAAAAAVVVAVAAAAVAAWCIVWLEAWELAAHVHFVACQAACFAGPGQVVAAVVAAAAVAGGTVLAVLPCATGLEDTADAADAAELGPVGSKREQLIC